MKMIRNFDRNIFVHLRMSCLLRFLVSVQNDDPILLALLFFIWNLKISFSAYELAHAGSIKNISSYDKRNEPDTRCKLPSWQGEGM